MSFEYLTNYEKMCLTASFDEIQRAYPHVPASQIEQDIKLMQAMNC